jgi:hypothetical protein
MLTRDDIDIGVKVLGEADGCTIPLKGIAKLFLHCGRATQTVQPHHLGWGHRERMSSWGHRLSGLSGVGAMVAVDTVGLEGRGVCILTGCLLAL